MSSASCAVISPESARSMPQTRKTFSFGMPGTICLMPTGWMTVRDFASTPAEVINGLSSTIGMGIDFEFGMYFFPT